MLRPLEGPQWLQSEQSVDSDFRWAASIVSRLRCPTRTPDDTAVLKAEICRAWQQRKKTVQDHLHYFSLLLRHTVEDDTALWREVQTGDRSLTTLCQRNLPRPPDGVQLVSQRLYNLRLRVLRVLPLAVVFFYGWHLQPRRFTELLVKAVGVASDWPRLRVAINLVISSSLDAPDGRSRRRLEIPSHRVASGDLAAAIKRIRSTPDWTTVSIGGTFEVDASRFGVDEHGIICDVIEASVLCRSRSPDDGSPSESSSPDVHRTKRRKFVGVVIPATPPSPLPTRTAPLGPLVQEQDQAASTSSPVPSTLPTVSPTYQAPALPTLQAGWAHQYEGRIRAIKSAFLAASTDCRLTLNVRRHLLSGADWIGDVQFATSTSVGGIDCNGDIFVLSADEFQSRSARGFRPNKCVLVRGEAFSDRRCMRVSDYLARLLRRFPEDDVEVQSSCDQGTRRVPVAALHDVIEEVTARGLAPQHAVNLLNLEAHAEVDRPLALRLDRFRDLKTQIYLDSRSGPGKGATAGWGALHSSLRSCDGFNLLGTTGTFSGPHVDLLNGTWVRCLDGVKAWIIVPSMADEDFDDWVGDRDPPNWCPSGRTRIVVLEPDDVLWMPPGVLVVHAPLTIETCLMEGGMMWDAERREAIHRNITWIIENERYVTNEDSPEGLQRFIGARLGGPSGGSDRRDRY